MNMSKKQFNLFPLLLLTVALSSCGISKDNVFDYRAYDTGDFNGNYYTTFDSRLKGDKVLEEIRYTGTFIRNLSSLEEHVNEKESSSIDFYAKDEKGNQLDKPLIWNYAGTNVSESAPNGKEQFFGATHSISYGRGGDSSFAEGVLSKLYDGIVSCSGRKAQSRVQITSEGLGTLLPKQINKARYMSIALRGATDFDQVTRKLGQEASIKMNHVIDLKITLYKKNLVNGTYQPYSFIFNDVDVATDNCEEYYVESYKKPEGASGTHCLSFYFNECVKEGTSDEKFNVNDLIGVCAYSITYNLHPSQVTYGANTYDIVASKDEFTTENIHYGLMLYEIMMPGVTWR